VTALSNGGFVVAWDSANQDRSGEGVYAQRYDANGTAQGPEFRVNTTIADNQNSPSVTALSNGGFVVTWESRNQDGSGWGVYARRYDANGTAQGGEFQINTFETGNQERPSVTGLSNGGFFVAWESRDQDGSGYGVYGQRYDADGNAQGAEFRVNTYTEANQDFPSVTTLSGGRFVVTWQSNGQDGNGFGVYGQLFTPSGAAIRRGTDGDNTIEGGAAPDFIEGLAGNDRLKGGAGADELDGGEGSDRAIYTGSDVGVTVNLATGTGQGGHADGDTLIGIEDLTGSDFPDSLTGDAGDNRLEGGAGADTLDGGLGSDRAIYTGSNAAVSVDLATGSGTGGHVQGDILIDIENLIGSDFDDTFTGDTSIFSGADGNNWFDGGIGDDTLDGGAGSDSLIGGAGADALDGGDGNDRAIYAGSDGAVIVDLGLGLVLGGHAGGDTLMRIENLTGSTHADRLFGGDGENRFDGGAGNDTLNGRAGDDWLTGGAGNDELTGGAGRDRAIYAGSNVGVTVNLATNRGQGSHAQGDFLTGIEDLTGSGFADSLTGDRVDNQLDGGAGDDRLIGGAGADMLDGGGGTDTLDGGEGADVLTGGAGNDWAIYAGSNLGVNVNLDRGIAEGGHAQDDTLTGIEHLTGSGFADTLIGDNGDNRLDGGAGNDTLDGGAGNDTLDGGAGNDTLDGGAGSDPAIYARSDAGVTVNLATNRGQVGHAQGDTLIGIEHLTGSDHNDALTGDNGDNQLDGGAGNDSLDGGAGNDTLDGGAGNDRAVYAGSNEGVNVNLADGTTGQGGHAQGDTLTGIENLTGSGRADRLTGNNGDNRLDGGAGDDRLIGGAGNDSLKGGAGADTLNGGIGDDDVAVYAGSDNPVNVNLADGTVGGGHAQDDVLTGIEGLTGSDHNDTLTGDTGNNRFDGGAGEDMLDGGAGIDRAVYADSDQAVTVNLANGDGKGGHAQGDTLIRIEDLTGSDHNDTLIGDSRDNRFDGGTGNDSLNGGAGRVRDTLDGGEGADVLTGGAGNGSLIGGAGDDTLDGGDGDDTLDGGAGIDRATYAGSDERVYVNLLNRFILSGHANGDRLTGIEDLTGSAFDDTLTGDTGHNRLDGGGGNDRAVYAGSNEAVTVDLAAGSAKGGHAEGDVLRGIESLTGSDFNDILTGSVDENALDGGAGRDVLDGGGGNDYLTGGAGADVFVFRAIDGPVGDESADFEDGTDSIRILDGSLSFGDLTITDSSGDAVVTWGQNNTLTFQGLDRTLLTADDFAFV